ncbi:hypothetical protein [Vibrio cincinnatiensis]
MNKNGFTLFEALLSVMVLGSISTGIILKEVESRNQNERLRFIDEAMSIVKAVDHRIAIDGYDPDLWTKLKWDNEEDIVNSLIKEDLTSQYHDKCSGGKWKPETNAESNTKLISCNLWGSRRNFGETIKAELREDSLGFIQGFDLFISFDDIENFKKYFRAIKYSLNQISVNPSQELSGIYINSLVSASNGVDISSYECINDPLDCAIKLSLERSGGNEYIRADGSNSMIGEHLTFIESKGQSPLKCLRWSNTQRDGSGIWSKIDDEDCGIGIYTETNQPVMVDVVADTGTFKNVLLDQNCIYYQWNGNEVVNSGTTRPCGISNDGSEVFQVVPNSYNENIHTDKLYSNTIHTKSLITETLSSNVLEALDRLKTDIIESYTANGVINVNSDLTLNDLLRVNSNAYFNNNTYFNEDASFAKNINVTGDINTVGNVYGANLYATGEVGSNSIQTNYVNTTSLNTTDATIENNLTVNGTTKTTNLKVNDTLTASTANLSSTKTTNLTVTDKMRVNKRATEGESCSDVGLLATTTIGELLACVSGKWKKQDFSFTVWAKDGSSCGYRWQEYPISISTRSGFCEIGAKGYRKVNSPYCGDNYHEYYVCTYGGSLIVDWYL